MLVDVREEESERADMTTNSEDIQVVQELYDRYVYRLPPRRRPIVGAFHEDCENSRLRLRVFDREVRATSLRQTDGQVMGKGRGVRMIRGMQTLWKLSRTSSKYYYKCIPCVRCTALSVSWYLSASVLPQNLKLLYSTCCRRIPRTRASHFSAMPLSLWEERMKLPDKSQRQNKHR